MYDMHYDLLTILYTYLTKTNKNYNEQKLIEILNKIYSSNNIKGGIINLYFTPLNEMLDELDITKEECINIKNMLSKSIIYLKEYQEKGIIPKQLDYLISIESCDYITPNDLEELYNKYNLRSIIPVWNHQNQYGSGLRTTTPLTDLGKELINEAIRLGIIIDVSHANINTFNDILTIYENNTKENKVLIASHSNVRTLCDRERNLTDEQLKRLNDLDAYIGLFSNIKFVTKDIKDDYIYRIEKYLEHLDYIINIIKYNPNRIFLSTDDMNFSIDPSYHHSESFTQNMIPYLREILIKRYGEEITNNIMINNAKKLIKRVK